MCSVVWHRVVCGVCVCGVVYCVIFIEVSVVLCLMDVCVYGIVCVCRVGRAS